MIEYVIAALVAGLLAGGWAGYRVGHNRGMAEVLYYMKHGVWP